MGVSDPIWRPPQGFHDQTDQRIRSGIRNQRLIDTKSEMEMKTSQHNRASYADQSPHNRIGSYRRRHCREGIKEPKACNEKAYARPRRNSAFHAATSYLSYGTPDSMFEQRAFIRNYQQERRLGAAGGVNFCSSFKSSRSLLFQHRVVSLGAI